VAADGLKDEGLVWRTVCLRAALQIYLVELLLARTVRCHIKRHYIINSCQSAVTSEIVKRRFWSRVDV